MMRRFVMGLDVGGGGGRCLLLNLDDGTITTASRTFKHPLLPGSGGWGVGLDTERVWTSLGQASHDVLRDAGVAPKEVVGLAASSMRHGTVVLDADGAPLLATPNRDARAANQGLNLGSERGEEFQRRTGHWPSPICSAARWLWLVENSERDAERAHALLSISDWVGYRLSGELATEASQASETLLFDIEADEWAWDLVDSIGMPRKILPPVRAAGSELGRLTAEASSHLGLPEGIPVAVGGADTQLGLLGLGATESGDLGAVAGTTLPVQRVADQPWVDPEARLWTARHVLPGRWVTESNAGATGEALEWIAAALYPDARRPVAALVAEAGESPPGSEGVLSSFGVSLFHGRHLPLQCGSVSLSHWTSAHEASHRGHLARSVLEGIAYGVQSNVEQLLAAGGEAHSRVLLGGGVSRGSLWCRMLADVGGVPVAVAHTPHVTALGTAICASVGVGHFKTLLEGADALARLSDPIEPDENSKKTYGFLYNDWKTWFSATHDANAIAGDVVLQAATSAAHAHEHKGHRVPGRPSMLVTASMDDEALRALRELGEVTYSCYRDEMRLLTGAELVDALRGYDVFVTETDIVDVEALEELPDLRVICTCRGNPVNVDVAACTAFGIPVLYTPGRNAHAVADITVAFLLALTRKLNPAGRFLQEGDGNGGGDLARMGAAHVQFQGNELWRMTVGLVGSGRVGRQVIKRLQAFRPRILVYDPYLDADDPLLCGAEKVSLEELLAESDAVSLHARVTDESRGMIGEDELAQMKPGGLLINTARAALVDEDALVAALDSGHLGGASLDVFSVEPPGADHPLLSFPNVIATPHLGGNTQEVAAHQGAMVVEDLTGLLHGKRPEHLLNPEVLSSFDWKAPRTSPGTETLTRLHEAGTPSVCDFSIISDGENAPTPAGESPKDGPGASSPTRVRDAARGAGSGHNGSGEPAEAERKKGPLRGIARWRSRREDRKKKKVKQSEKASSPAIEATSSRQNMETILGDFVEATTIDENLQSFSRGKNITVHYVLTDIELSFYTRFRDGTISGGLGDPPAPPEVRLKMKAEILDGMFIDRINGTKAALTGKLSFAGDTIKAISLKRIQGDFNRLYQAAREKVGDPIVTSSGVSPDSKETSAPRPVTAPVIASGSQAGDVRDEIVQVVQELYEAGLITATGGNVSVRAAGRDGEVWITPNALHKGSLHWDVMTRIGLDGEPLEADSRTPSSERFVHTKILRARPDVEAVIHTHAPQATILALTGERFLPISTEAAFIGEIPRVPFIMPGSQDLAEQVAQALGNDGAAVLMQNHGLVVAGSTLRSAVDTTLVIEQTAMKILACRRLGVEPPVLPDEIIETLREIGPVV